MSGRVCLRGDDGGDEELGAVGVLAGVGHGQETLLGVLELEVLIGELLAVDCGISISSVIIQYQGSFRDGEQLTGLATGTVALGEVTTLDHELLDNTVEGRALVAEALLAGSESAEVLGSLGDSLSVQTHGDAAEGLIAVGDVEVDLVGDLGALGSLSGLREEGQSHSGEEEGRDESLNAEHDGRWALNSINWERNSVRVDASENRLRREERLSPEGTVC